MPGKAKTKVASEVDELKIPTVALRGDFIDGVQVVASTSASLLVSVGRLNEGDGETVLVPFVQLNLGSLEDSDGSAYVRYSEVLTLDNAFFVLSDLAQELKAVCAEVGAVGQGNLKPEPARLELARKFALSAKLAVEGALEELNRVQPVSPSRIVARRSETS